MDSLIYTIIVPFKGENMAIYTVDLTPNLVNQVSEGNLDTSVSGGLSNQRTMDAVLVINGSNRKQLHRLADGETYNDTTFEVPSASGISIGNAYFASGDPVISQNNVTEGHPTASSISGSTL